MKRYILTTVVFTQLGIIFLLGLQIYNKQNVLGSVSVQPLSVEDLVNNNQSKLKYLYEPYPNSIATEEAELRWIDKDEVKYTINEDTLNETKNYTVLKPDKAYRILTLGDSFTYGLYVNTHENWTSLLETRLNALSTCQNINSLEVINLGLSGNDIQHSVERYRLRGMKYNPDLVIWFLKRDDFTEINELLREKEQQYREEMKSSGEYEELLKKGVPNPVLNRLLTDMQNIRQELGTKKLFEMQKNYFEELFVYYQGKLVIAYIPYEDAMFADYFKSKNENGTLYYLELPDFLQDQNYTFFPEDSHPNRRGHEMIAKKIQGYLIQNNLIACK